MNRIDYIVVHCSDSPHGRGDSAETIHRWHKEKGWSGIGYHYVIDEHGNVEAGRPHYWQGAHVRAHNSHSLGICLLGIDEFTDKQMDALAKLVEELSYEYPFAQVVGHRDLDPKKTCPNFNVKEWWNRTYG